MKSMKSMKSMVTIALCFLVAVSLIGVGSVMASGVHVADVSPSAAPESAPESAPDALPASLDALKTLLAQMETQHALSAQAIVALRERIANFGLYTPAAQAGLEARVKAKIGASQKAVDGQPNYRASAP